VSWEHFFSQLLGTAKRSEDGSTNNPQL